MPIGRCGPPLGAARIRMGFAGELTTIGLSEVFQNVAFNRLTGVLTVTERGRRAAVYLDDGMIRAFKPDAEGPASGTLEIASTDPAKPLVRVAVSGGGDDGSIYVSTFTGIWRVAPL